MSQKKEIIDFKVVSNERLASGRYSLLKLSGTLPEEIRPGQFVQVDTDCRGVMLRRPISINRVERDKRLLWLLVRDAGAGTHSLVESAPGRIINIILPLGNAFTIAAPGSRVLLVGGGVGVAPLLELGSELRRNGVEPVFLLGARTQSDLLELDEFGPVGTVHVTTEDGSAGVRGFVTDHPAMELSYDMIYCCGPAPMMKAVASKARQSASPCEVSLENMMACGLGACLCCVEKTVKGNVCVCTDGPVFNINELTW